MWFMAEDDGGGGGDSFEPDLTSGHEGSANDTPEGTSDITPETKAEPTAAFDAKAFAEHLGPVLADSFAKAQPKTPEPEKKLSPEEAAKLLNVWTPDDTWYAKYDNLGTRKQAVAEQRDALIKQADTIAQMRMQQMRDDLDARYAPMVTAYQQQQQEAQQGRFDKAYTQLSDPKFRPVLTAAAQSILAEKKQFANEGEMFKEVAARTEAIIKQVNPDFKLSATQVAKQAGRSLPSTTPGANGGGGRSTDTGKRPRAVDLLPGPA